MPVLRPLNRKNSVKNVLRECIICLKVKPSFNQPMMRDLPSRIIHARPFLKVGCDFAGPILIKESSLR